MARGARGRSPLASTVADLPALRPALDTYTWDGLPVSPEPPFGAAIIVYRRPRPGAIELLVLHRRAATDDQVDWAWGPPSGARWPGEPIGETARRELREETGLARYPRPVVTSGTDWPVFTIEIDTGAAIMLSGEHDRYAWLSPASALEVSGPDLVRDQIRTVLSTIDLSPG
ncbi:MAG: hypothetical protein AVDCRST_MAG33-418 [uncultured Thermomicrobiales bacterium]|uniref:Nudix hydrolase domain-containing protein n=1 Tax=uncultured Thermomicrobiales bacterium TaxID=1645740 RepID=A0A6J4UE63_9BACT|nr:MAG: hypothetical protein AVDCRST_MAG33-418 [uncultured Thermomicrobiales bacterium]